MPILPRVRSVWNTLFRKDRLDRELDDELRAAVETLTARYTADGMAPRTARQAAVRAIAGRGGLEEMRDAVREGRLGAELDALLLDLRYAARALRQASGLTAVIVITLALGIGANTAIFSVVHAMLLEPLPYRHADRLAFIWLGRATTPPALSSLHYGRGPMSGPDFGDLRRGTRTFADLAGIWATGAIALTGDGDPEQLRAAFVTTNFFQVLGAEAALGRTFRPQDSAAGAEPTILLGWELFERRFGADPSIVGRKIHVNDGMTTVIGVMPRRFRLLLPPDASVPDRLQAFVPFWPDLEGGPRRNLFLRVIGRMRPGVTIAEARADVAAVAADISRQIGAERTFSTVALQADNVREIRAPLLALFAGVGILLTIACVNVAGLLVARAASRARETALRIALGASHGRLLRQSLAEGLLLTSLGAAAGLFAGYVSLRLLVALTPESLSRLDAARMDLPVLAFTLGVSTIWGGLFSLAPLTELFRSDPTRSLHGQGGTTAAPVRYRTRATLVTVQVALSLVLLVGAGLLLRAFAEVLRVDPGFRTERHLTFRLLIPDRHDFHTFTTELHRRLAAIPGVSGVGTISHVPYDDLPNWALPYGLEGPVPPGAPWADSRSISPGLFEALGVQLLEGRFFTAGDRNPKAPVVIVDEMLARHLWPGRSAIGQQFFTRVAAERVTVVGVIRHLRLRSLVDNLLPQIFVPWAIAQRNPTAYVLRTERDPMVVAAEARAAVVSLDPKLAVYDVRPLQAYVDAARATRRFTMLLAALFAMTALALTSVGIYGVLAYAVAHRRREFGVRRALGADTARVIREVLREGLAFVLAGSAGGLVGALAAARLLQSQLYAVHPRDPIAYAAALGLVLLGAALACWVPAYRAATISPMDAIKEGSRVKGQGSTRVKGEG